MADGLAQHWNNPTALAPPGADRQSRASANWPRTAPPGNLLLCTLTQQFCGFARISAISASASAKLELVSTNRAGGARPSMQSADCPPCGHAIWATTGPCSPVVPRWICAARPMPRCHRQPVDALDRQVVAKGVTVLVDAGAIPLAAAGRVADDGVVAAGVAPLAAVKISVQQNVQVTGEGQRQRLAQGQQADAGGREETAGCGPSWPPVGWTTNPQQTGSHPHAPCSWWDAMTRLTAGPLSVAGPGSVVAVAVILACPANDTGSPPPFARAHTPCRQAARAELPACAPL